jgi:hypothetical protein
MLQLILQLSLEYWCEKEQNYNMAYWLSLEYWCEDERGYSLLATIY